MAVLKLITMRMQTNLTVIVHTNSPKLTTIIMSVCINGKYYLQQINFGKQNYIDNKKFNMKLMSVLLEYTSSSNSGSCG